MDNGKKRNAWERTPVTNLLRNGTSGKYYGRFKVRGKQIWRTLETTVFSVAKLRLPDMEKQVRSAGPVAIPSKAAGETSMERFIALYRERTAQDTTLAPLSRSRREVAVKALLKTWPDLPQRDARRINSANCREWASRAIREGTGFAPIGSHVKRVGMSGSGFNKTLDALRGVLEIARELGMAYGNAAAEVSKQRITQKRLTLPSVEQFHAIVKRVGEAGARQSRDCADLIRGLRTAGHAFQKQPRCDGRTSILRVGPSQYRGRKAGAVIGQSLFFRLCARCS